MTKMVFNVPSWLPVAVADNAVFTDTGYMALQGASGTQLTKVEEIYVGGQATVASPTYLVFARDSTVGVTLTALASPNKNGPVHASSAALAAVVVGFIASTTKPKRDNSVTGGSLNLAYNAYGGAVRWQAAGPDDAFVLLGNTASFGEASLSAFTGGTPGLCGAHIKYETV